MIANENYLGFPTGIAGRRLPIANLGGFEGPGVYYAATYMKAQLCAGEEVAGVGAGNCAGQAAVFLAQIVGAFTSSFDRAPSPTTCFHQPRLSVADELSARAMATAWINTAALAGLSSTHQERRPTPAATPGARAALTYHPWVWNSLSVTASVRSIPLSPASTMFHR